MTKPISIVVYGIPRPAGSKRAFPIKKNGEYTGRSIVTDASGQLGRDWRADVKAAAVEAYQGPPLGGALYVLMCFFMPRPKSHFGTGKNAQKLRRGAPVYHTKRPDVLKLARAVEDALTGIVWADDSQIVRLYYAKHYADFPGRMSDRAGCEVIVGRMS